jgi:hypothetical protein
LRQPQRCPSDAYLAVFAALLAKPGKCLLGWLGLEAHQACNGARVQGTK